MLHISDETEILDKGNKPAKWFLVLSKEKIYAPSQTGNEFCEDKKEIKWTSIYGLKLYTLKSVHLVVSGLTCRLGKTARN